MSSNADGLRIREAVRAIVRSPDDRVLLVRFEFPSGRRWALPGGGIDPGESAHEALRRELHEELGLLDARVGPHVWNRLHVVPFVNGRYDGQREQIYVIDVDQVFEPRPALTWDQLRAEYVHELRWWHLDEIEAATDQWFVPQPLAALLRSLTTDGLPISPVDVPV
jgi:8-oxo-dGTP pyrophosphatase MutT (NUDIX family)